MSISSKSVVTAYQYRSLFKRVCQILERGHCESDHECHILNNLFRNMEWVRIGSVPRGQWAPPLREWSQSEQREADETDRQYEEVFAKMNEVLPIVFPGKSKERAADIVQSVCWKLRHGEDLDVVNNDADARVLTFVREVNTRLSNAIPVPV